MDPARIEELEGLSHSIQQGKKGVDFLVEEEYQGYAYTDLEAKFERCCRALLQEMADDPLALSAEDLSRLLQALPGCKPARDSVRDRTPAGGGDWTTIESLVSCMIDDLCEGLTAALEKQASQGASVLEQVPRRVLKGKFGGLELYKMVTAYDSPARARLDED